MYARFYRTPTHKPHVPIPPSTGPDVGVREKTSGSAKSGTFRVPGTCDDAAKASGMVPALIEFDPAVSHREG